MRECLVAADLHQNNTENTNLSFNVKGKSQCSPANNSLCLKFIFKASWQLYDDK